MQEGLAHGIQQHRQADQVLVVVDAAQRVAVVQHVRVRLELQVVLGELEAAEAEHGMPCIDAVGAGHYQHLAAALLQRERSTAWPAAGSAPCCPRAPGHRFLGVHGGVPAEAVVGVVEAGLEGARAPRRLQPAVQQGRCADAGQDVVQGGVDRAAGRSVGVGDLSHLDAYARKHLHYIASHLALTLLSNVTYS